MDGGEGEGVIGDHGVIYRNGHSRAPAIHAVPPTLLRACLHRRGWGSSVVTVNLIPQTASATSKVRPGQGIPTVK